jgi:hypothetical protein
MFRTFKLSFDVDILAFGACFGYFWQSFSILWSHCFQVVSQLSFDVEILALFDLFGLPFTNIWLVFHLLVTLFSGFLSLEL